MTRALTREQILAAKTMPVGEVEVAELGGVVKIAGLSLRAADGVRELIGKDENGAAFQTRVALLFLCDDHGEPLFGPDDGDLLKSVPNAAIAKIAKSALDLNGLSEKADADAKNGSGPAESAASASV